MREIEELKEIESDYRYSEGTVAQRDIQAGFAVNNFENLLRIANNLKYELERREESSRIETSHNRHIDIEFDPSDFDYEEDSEPDEANATMNFARYGM